MNIPTPILKRYLLISCWTLSGLFASWPVFASHIIGGELSYERLGGDTFKITLDIYRDCYSGIPWFDTPAHLAIFDENGNPVQNISASLLNLQPIYSDTIPNNIQSDPCLFPPDSVCVEHARYETEVILSGPGGFYVVYQRCCRNQSVSNIMNSSESGATYFIYISPHAKEVNNSSPTFSDSTNNSLLPPVYVCVNKPIANPHTAYDAEGDSLVYKFYTPFLGASFDNPQPYFGYPPYSDDEIKPPPYDTVTWIDPPYNLDSLLGPSNIAELEIDPHTGLITGFPIITGQFVIGVSVEEYRNDTLLSVIRRDFQYNVGPCDTIIASIVAPDAQCDELTVNFGNETDVAQEWEWYFDWPATTPSSNEEKPSFTYPDTGSYTVALIAQPGSQCVDTGYAEIFLQYNSLTADFSVQTFDCADQSALLLQDLSVDSVSPPSQWLWTVSYDTITLTSTEQNPVFEVPNPSSGTATLVVQSLNGCEQTKTLNFETGGNNPVDVLQTVQTCLGESAELNPNGPTTGFTYSWGPPVPPGQQNLPNPTVTPLENTTYPVTITGYNGLCQSIDSVTVEVNPVPVLAFVPDTDCDAQVVHFINQSQNAPSGYLWNFGDPATNLDESTQANPTYTYPGYGTYTVTLMTSPNSLCKDTISQVITLTEKILEAGFGFDYSDCNETSVDIQFFDETVNNQFNTTEWEWVFSGIFNGTSTQQNPSIFVTQEGTLNVSLTVTTGEDCVSAAAPQSLEIAFTQLPGIIDNQEILGCLSGGVTLNPGGDPAYQYLWSPATGLSCTTCPSPLANPGQTTTYTVQILNFSADTCEITRQVTVIVPGDVGLVASNDVLTCDEQATLTATTSLLPVTLAWFKDGVQVGSGPTLTVIVSGETDYVVVATDVDGCQYSDTVTVAGGPVDMETSGDQIFCSNEALDVFATNLDPNDILSYQWTPAASINGPADVPNPDVIETPGEQMLYVEAVNQFGCAKQDSVYIAVVDENIQLAFSSQVGCSGSVVDFTNLSTNAFDFVWNFGDPTTTGDVSNAVNPTYTYPDTGTYTVSLTVGFDVSCTDTFYQDVVIVEPEFIPDFTYEYVGCDVDSIEVQFHDSSINFLNNTSSWYWQTSTNETATIPDPVFTIYPGEDFFISLTIGTPNGCEGTVQKEIKLEFIEINLSGTLVLCQGDTTELNPLGNFSYDYHWTPGLSISDPNAPNPQVWPAQTTTYTVEITNFAPDTCSLTRTVTVFVPEKIEVEASDDTFTCGEPVTVSATSNISPTKFEWVTNPGDVVVSILPSLITTPAEDTWYTVTGTDEYNCEDTANVFIANEAVNIDLASDEAECPEEEIQLTATNNVADHDLVYIWQATPPGQIIPPINTPTVTALTPPAGQTATYSVTTTNQFGCTAMQAEDISSYDFVPTVVPEVLACANVLTQLNPGASPDFNYLWSPDTGLSCTDCPNPTVTVSQTMNYTVTVTDNFGSELCAKVIEVEVFVPPIIGINETVDTFTCGEPIVISAQANVPASLEWFDGQGNPLGTGGTLSVNPQTEEIYIVVATDGFDCFTSDTVVVSNNQLDIVLDGNGVIDTCPMPSYNICITNLDPTDILAFEWTASNGGTILSGGDTACPEVTAPQGVTSIFTANVSNQWGCTTTEEYEVTTYTFDPVIRDVISICPGVPTSINPGVGSTDYIYSWSPQTGLDCYDCPNPQATLLEDQIYTVFIQGYNGADTCSMAQTVQVRVNPLINLQTSPPDTSICEPVDVTLSAVSSSGIITEYAWYGEAGNPIANGSEITITPDATEVYYVTATDTLGCRDTAKVNIYAYPIDVSLDDRYNFCVENSPLTIVMHNNAPVQELTIEWAPQEYIIDMPGDTIIVVDVPGTMVFTAQITNQFGCTATDSMTVLYFDIELTLGEITASEDTIILHSGEFSQLGIDYDPTYSYHWEPAAGLDDPNIHNPTAMPAVTTTYTVTVIDGGGCTATRKVTIYVINPECREPNIFIPNAFTPNGDGHNDVLYVRSNILESLEFAVYNRWGQKVFETTDQSTGWDGTFKGKLLTPDTYGFYVKGKCYNGEEFFKKGNVLLLR
jgi:gliding motility-associated-like protein